jgi:hypothetical protein
MIQPRTENEITALVNAISIANPTEKTTANNPPDKKPFTDDTTPNRENLLTAILLHDTQPTINTTSINDNTVTITTNHATYTIPMRIGTGMQTAETGAFNPNEQLTITCTTTGESFTTTHQTLPEQLTEYALNELGDKWVSDQEYTPS